MSPSTVEPRSATATRVCVTNDTLTLDLSDGRSISAPLAWYPRLLHSTVEERARWRLIGQGQGIHWPHLDEDVSVENVLAGKPSAESQGSLKKWLGRRRSGDDANRHGDCIQKKTIDEP